MPTHTATERVAESPNQTFQGQAPVLDGAEFEEGDQEATLLSDAAADFESGSGATTGGAPGDDFSLMGNGDADFSMAGYASVTSEAVATAPAAPMEQTMASPMATESEQSEEEREESSVEEETPQLEMAAGDDPADTSGSENGVTPAADGVAPGTAEGGPNSAAQMVAAARAAHEEREAEKEELPEPEWVKESAGGGGGGGGSAPQRREITEPFPTSTEEDEAFGATETAIDVTATSQRTTNPADQEAATAQLAAPIADNEQMGHAQKGQVAAMDQAEPGQFNAAAFKQKLMDKLRDLQLPDNLEEAEDFDDHNNIDSIASSASSDAMAEGATAAGPVEQQTSAEPDPNSIEEREVTPLPEPPVGEAPEQVPASEGMPQPRPHSHIHYPLEDNVSELDYVHTSNDIDDHQLSIANEPTFTTALESKNETHDHAANAPVAFREQEDQNLAQIRANADAMSQRQTDAMHLMRNAQLTQMEGVQQQTSKDDTAARRKVSSDIDIMFGRTKRKVEGILKDLNDGVKSRFDAAASTARTNFEDYVDGEFRAYKRERYGGVGGGALWLKDKILDLPSEVNVFFTRGRRRYINEMDGAMTDIADYVATQLTAATKAIEDGKKEIDQYVADLPEDLKQVGLDASTKIQNKFDDLTASVDSAQDDLVDSIAQQYMDSLQQVDKKIEEMKEANKGLVTKAKEAVEEVVNSIVEIKNTLTGLLAAAVAAIGVIVKDPIGFLGKLISGLKQGFENFGKNLLNNIMTGLIEWLTGSLGGVGIQVPDNLFSLSGIFDLAMQIMGLTWDYFRGKAVKHLGEPMVKAMETGFEIFMIIKDKGIAGLWEYIKEQFSDLKELVMDTIRDMIITKVIEAGIKWILGLMSPAGAFLKAAMMIIDIVRFFVERGSQIIELVKAFVDGITAIASGNVSAVAKAVENALVKAIPVLIGFLAALAGVTGLTKKVQKLVGRIRGRIDRAIDKVILKGKKAFRKLVKSGKAKVKGAVRSVLNWLGVKEKYKDAAGESHELYLKGDEKNAKLMRASDKPLHFKAYIETVEDEIAGNAALESKHNADIRKAKKYDNEISDLLYRFKKTTGTYRPAEFKKGKAGGKSDGELLKDKMALLIPVLKRLPVIEGQLDQIYFPQSEIDYPEQEETIPTPDMIAAGNNDASKKFEGKKMVAKTLTLQSSEIGSRPSYYSNLYSFLNKNFRIVAGHLLYHRLHGKGTDQENLAPISESDNRKMNTFEKEAFKKVFDEKAVLYYEVRMTYGTKDEADIMSYLPTRIDAKIYKKKFNGDPTKKTELENAALYDLRGGTKVYEGGWPTKLPTDDKSLSYDEMVVELKPAIDASLEENSDFAWDSNNVGFARLPKYGTMINKLKKHDKDKYNEVKKYFYDSKRDELIILLSTNIDEQLKLNPDLTWEEFKLLEVENIEARFRFLKPRGGRATHKYPADHDALQAEFERKKQTQNKG